jgi:heptosyltransferase-2
MKKLLVVHTWGIGDMVMFTPALQLLAYNLPNATIDLLVGQFASAEVVRGSNLFRNIIPMQRGVKLISQIIGLRKEHYDCCIVTSGVNPLKGGVFAWLLGIPIRIGDNEVKKSPFYTHQVRLDPNLHRSEHNINLIKKLISVTGLSFNSQRYLPRFWISNQAEREAERFLIERKLTNRVLIGIHCGSGEKQAFKRWPKDSFRLLIKHLCRNDEQLGFLLFAGPGEENVASDIAKAIEHRCTVVAGFSLQVVAALLKRCYLVVANDSGLGHVAAAVGVTVISIFGPTDPVRTAPRGRDVYIVKSDKPCSPCHWKKPKKCDGDCLTSIQVSDVANVAEKILYGRNS